MRDHPIPSVTEPLQYRAIGIVRGIYSPKDPNQFTRGRLLGLDGSDLEAVVLGRVLNLMRRHVEIDRPHLWVVYPRCRQADQLHLQIAGIWEPSTLGENNSSESDFSSKDESSRSFDQLNEGDDYFSIRGELIYTRADDDDLVVKIRQKRKADGSRPLPFKLNIKGKIPFDYLRHFVSLEVRRIGQKLHLEDFSVIEPMSTRGGAKRAGKPANLDRDNRHRR